MVSVARAAVAKRAAAVAAIVAAAQTVVPAAAARGKRLVLVLPAEDLRGRQLHISTAELAGCCCARLPRCAPAQAREPPVASAIAASVTCGSSKREG